MLLVCLVVFWFQADAGWMFQGSGFEEKLYNISKNNQQAEQKHKDSLGPQNHTPWFCCERVPSESLGGQLSSLLNSRWHSGECQRLRKFHNDRAVELNFGCAE